MTRWGERVGQACALCWGAFYTTPSQVRKYCSTDCQHAARRKLCECDHCGREYTPKRGGRTTFCSRACAFASQRGQAPEVVVLQRAHRTWTRALRGAGGRAPCRVCFRYHTRRGLTCSAACQDYRNRIRVRDAYQPTTTVVRCPECRKEFRQAHGGQVLCSRRCSNRRHRRNEGKNHRKRARRYGVPYEPIAKRKVFERDAWRCGICGEAIDRRTKAPHPRSPSLDHIIPLASPDSPGHVWANVQAAHFMCNSVKGSGSAGSQLRMALEGVA